MTIVFDYSSRNLPKHVLKFGFRDAELTDVSDALNASQSQDESILKSKKRRVYMDMMVNLLYTD